MKIYDERVKDPSSRRILTELRNSQSIRENGYNVGILTILHALLIPSTKKITRDETGKKSVLKNTIRDSQLSFSFFGKSMAEVEGHIQNFQQKRQPIQPFIIIIGKALTERSDVLIYFDSTKFKFHNLLKAVDTCFKIFHVFNLEYPLPSYAVWQFLQEYFYKNTCNKEKLFPSVVMLKSELSKS